jgi:hypothetical protein
MMPRAARSLLVCLVLPLPLGCGSGRPAIHPVSGQVLVNDKPAAHALVAFHPIGGSGPDAIHPTGEVDGQGRFTLTSQTRGDGAPEGEYRVTVVWYLATKVGPDDYQTRNYLPEAYGRVETTDLKATVVKGTNELPTFRLRTR